MKFRLLAAAFIVAAFFMPVPASAEAIPYCSDDHTALLEAFARKYDEHPVAMALVVNGNVLEVLRSESGSWTMLVTTPGGLTCGVMSGETWQFIKPLYGEPL